MTTTTTTADFDDVFALCESQTRDAIEIKKNAAFRADLAKLAVSLTEFQEQVQAMSRIAPRYDPKMGSVRANGFRSFVKIATGFIGVVGDQLRRAKNRGNDVSDLALLVEKMVLLYSFILEVAELNDEQHCGEFFPQLPTIAEGKIRDLSEKIALSDFSVFYGSACGFHYGSCDFRKFAKPLVLTMAAFSQIYEGGGNKLLRLLKALVGVAQSPRRSSAQLARDVTLAIREKPVELCKTLFDMSEMKVLHLNSFDRDYNGPKIKANCTIELPPERMSVENAVGARFQVPVPSSHLGSDKPVRARLISPFRTPEMIGSCPCMSYSWLFGWSCACKIVPEAECIIFHLHGGGFVSQTSISHSPYLKKWAQDIGVPVFSVDYSTAPEAPFPRALEETLYAYCWMRNNFPKLGCSSKRTRVILVGDSAGANLSMGLLQLCIEHSLPLPDHALVVYPSLLCQMYPSPSRLVTFLDPLVMFPCLLRCLNAYADQNYVKTCPRSFMQELESCQSYENPLLSPLLTPREILRHFPPMTLISTDIDPCLDETVAFSNKLYEAGVKVSFQVLNGLPHGFLSVAPASNDCDAAVYLIAEKIRDIVLQSV